MNDLQKVMVVDSGDRHVVDNLSMELAEHGYASVTTSFEAASQVLDVIPRPAAIFLNMPSLRKGERYEGFLAAAGSLRDNALGVPVFIWERDATLPDGGISAFLGGTLPAASPLEH